MAYVKTNKAGTRFTGYYRDRTGRRRSCGTFDSHREAMTAAKEREKIVRNPASITVKEWADAWLSSTTEIEPRTIVSYRATFDRLIIPILGRKSMGQITPADVYAMLDRLEDQGESPRQILECKKVLGSSFRPLVARGIVPRSPTIGVRAPKQTPKRITKVITSTEIKAISEALPTDAARLFALFMFVTGLRFGEATEIRVSDLVIDGDSGPKLLVQRRAVDVGASRNAGERFLVLPATKSGDSRIIDLPVPMVGSLKRHIDQYGLASDDLLFSLGIMDVPEEDSDAPGLGERWNKGDREFQHGTLASSESGRCRCSLCAAAKRSHRREMKARAGRLRRNPRESDPRDHLPGDVWRRMWRGAIKQAGLDWFPRTHDLRHATASYLLDSTDPVYSLYDVMQILGHKSIKTTEQYLHRVSSKPAPKVFNDLFEERG